MHKPWDIENKGSINGPVRLSGERKRRWQVIQERKRTVRCPGLARRKSPEALPSTRSKALLGRDSKPSHCFVSSLHMPTRPIREFG